MWFLSSQKRIRWLPLYRMLSVVEHLHDVSLVALFRIEGPDAAARLKIRLEIWVWFGADPASSTGPRASTLVSPRATLLVL
jgi:hypothetical protein